MPADLLEKVTTSPVACASANGTYTPDKLKNASEHRKTSKPIMEKRRRARINESLGQLKTLILDALKKDSSRHSKLEKADILEMTVKHLRNLHRVQMTALTGDITTLSKYRAGFNECMNEVSRFLSTCDGVNTEVKSRLLNHLSSCLGQMIAMGYPQPAPAQQTRHVQPLNVQLPSTLPVSGVSVSCKLSPAEGISPKIYGGFQLVPATDGQFAFLIHNPSFASAATSVIPVYTKTSMPVTVNCSSASVVPSPVQGVTLFAGVSRASSVSPGADLESDGSVWRPW
ncbi:transcription factor HES-4-B-like isoform X2 [Paramormyrops kingsleyae]|uniref:transcription factor HES-4-B-like isoform X2 n=1 Tax=Paramormyrops kingsleyae TaxID=1676925 RepID=UPI003B97345F